MGLCCSGWVYPAFRTFVVGDCISESYSLLRSLLLTGCQRNRGQLLYPRIQPDDSSLGFH